MLKDSRALKRFSRLALRSGVISALSTYYFFGAGFVLLSLQSGQATMPYRVVRAPVPRVVLTCPVLPVFLNCHPPVVATSTTEFPLFGIPPRVTNLNDRRLELRDLSIALYFAHRVD